MPGDDPQLAVATCGVDKARDEVGEVDVEGSGDRAAPATDCSRRRRGRAAYTSRMRTLSVAACAVAAIVCVADGAPLQLPSYAEPGIAPDAKDEEPTDMDVELDSSGKESRAVFPHKAHTQWMACAACHTGIFEMEKGKAKLTMADMGEGKQCGACHGKVAAPDLTSCPDCHKATNTGQHRSHPHPHIQLGVSQVKHVRHQHDQRAHRQDRFRRDQTQ